MFNSYGSGGIKRSTLVAAAVCLLVCIGVGFALADDSPTLTSGPATVRSGSYSLSPGALSPQDAWSYSIQAKITSAEDAVLVAQVNYDQAKENLDALEVLKEPSQTVAKPVNSADDVATVKEVNGAKQVSGPGPRTQYRGELIGRARNDFARSEKVLQESQAELVELRRQLKAGPPAGLKEPTRIEISVPRARSSQPSAPARSLESPVGRTTPTSGRPASSGSDLDEITMLAPGQPARPVPTSPVSSPSSVPASVRPPVSSPPQPSSSVPTLRFRLKGSAAPVPPSGPKTTPTGVAGIGVLVTVVTVANVAMTVYEVSQQDGNKGQSTEKIIANEMKEALDRRGGRSVGAALLTAFDVGVMSVVGIDPQGVVEDGIGSAVRQTLPGMGVLGQLGNLMLPEDNGGVADRVAPPVGTPSVPDHRSGTEGDLVAAVNKDADKDSAAPVSEVGSDAPTDVAKVGSEGGDARDVSTRDRVGPGGKVTGSSNTDSRALGDLGAKEAKDESGSSQADVVGPPEASDDGKKDEETLGTAFDPNSGDGNDNIEPATDGSTSPSCFFNCGPSSIPDPTGDGVDGDSGGCAGRCVGLADGRSQKVLGMAGAVDGLVGRLTRLLNGKYGVGVIDLVANLSEDRDGRQISGGHRKSGDLLSLLKRLFTEATGRSSHSSSASRSSTLDFAELVADWGVDGISGPLGGSDGSGPGGLATNSDNDGYDGSEPRTPQGGGRKDSGQRVSSTRSTAGSRTIHRNLSAVTTTGQRQGVAVKAPTVPQSSQKLAAPKAPTAINNTGPVAQTQGPITKLSSPSNATSQIQSPTDHLSSSE